MKDHYSTLGVDRNASPEEIKRAFKSQAMKHHPDRGGDAKKFQELNEAYSTLSDPQQKAMYDHGPTPNFGQGFQHFNFNFGGGGGNPLDPFQDAMNQFGFVFRSNAHKNRDLNLNCRINLRDSYLGRKMNISYNLPSGRTETLDLQIPAGVETGQSLRVAGYGDDTMPNVTRGDLTVNIEVDRDPKFYREGLNLVTKIEIDIFDAMLGCKKKVTNIDDSEVEITIRPGTQNGQKYSCQGLGFRNIKFQTMTGDLVVEVSVKTLTSNNPDVIEQIKQLAEKMR
jgi:curved DNA-binding protein